ncbi:MAG: hypothetical protein ABIH42_08590 [Planctomycetota bacterium]
MIEQVSNDIIIFPASMTTEALYAKYPGKALYVEPLSVKQPLGKFISGGGLGFGSLKNGTFASKLFKVQTTEFTTGSDYSTNVNAGYPLHRLVECAPHELSPVPAGEIIKITVPLREKPKVKVLFKKCNINEAKPSHSVDNFIWVNDAAAKILNVKEAGAVSIYETEPEDEGEEIANVYEKRFFEDKIPSGHKTLKVLTMPSSLVKIKELSEGAEGILTALYVHLGVLVVLSGTKGKIAQVAAELSKLPLTFILPEKK